MATSMSPGSSTHFPESVSMLPIVSSVGLVVINTDPGFFSDGC